MTSSVSISVKEYQDFQRFLEKNSGIVLGEKKEYLLASRLSALMKQRGIVSWRQLLERIERGGDSVLKSQIIDAMTTNETFWFRDQSHFRILSEYVFPRFENRRLRLWSAACSSGQEPYSISIAREQYVKKNKSSLSLDILATDLSSSILNEAKKACYCGLAVSRGLDQAIVDQFFNRVDNCIQLKPEIARAVSFRIFNLTGSYASLGKFDVVFCRNVLIYFSAEMKYEILRRIAGVLNPRGYLFLGSTEGPPGLTDFFEMHTVMGGLFYQKK